MTATGETLSVEDGADAGLPRGPQLFRVLTSDRPLLPPSRHELRGVDEVALGRGDEAGARREGRRLILTIPDPRMSGIHARLARQRAHWIVEDLGSKNGVLVNGTRAERAVVVDRDRIELGTTQLILRESLPCRGYADAGAARWHELETLLPPLAALFDQLDAVARSEAAVLLSGPTGAGKELVARAVHAASGRPGRFVPVNCGALPAGLVEGELFGHRRGAFSGADRDHDGLVAASHGGTLFLDEIGDLPPPAQATLLRVVQEREVRAVGATTASPIDLRVVAASHRDLEAMVATGEFRDDLLARLSGFVAVLPPLRERREDLGLVIAALLRRIAGDRAEAAGIELRAARALLAHDWPRNVRELESCLRRGWTLGDGLVRAADLPSEMDNARVDPAVDDALSEPDRELRDRLLGLLAQHRGNISAVARDLGKVRGQIHRWLDRFGIDARRFRG
jgi:DNA-binding NtrC family response regulator